MKKHLWQLSCQLCHLPGSLQFFFLSLFSPNKKKTQGLGGSGGYFFFSSRTGNAKIRGRNSEGEVRRERESIIVRVGLEREEQGRQR